MTPPSAAPNPVPEDVRRWDHRSTLELPEYLEGLSHQQLAEVLRRFPDPWNILRLSVVENQILRQSGPIAELVLFAARADGVDVDSLRQVGQWALAACLRFEPRSLR